ncbi:dTMP kinase [Nesterenkonia ebinurensis]|uniref:dTMP kinase n=1 Tax=Nesterenkonia ebinurensis TaxID=2608252 RepID=UPI00123D27BA|nr:dTMP kinase [Nesterenkonia ebinurensis]
MSEQSKGLFVVFEGGEGAGKTTQLQLLEDWLTGAGHTVLRTREPGGTEIGERIRGLLLEHGQGEVDPRTETLLFAASRAAHVTQKIRPALASGAVVLCDRYIDSSLAYQGAGRGLGVAEVAQINAWATQGLQPDVTVLLDLDPALSAQRRAARDGGAAGDRIESADLVFHAALRQAFLDRAAGAPKRYLVLDATGSMEQLHAEIRGCLQPLLNGAAGAD